MKIYTVASKLEGRFEEDIYTNLAKAEKAAARRSKIKQQPVYIYIYSKDEGFNTDGRLWYEGFEIFENGICVRA